MKVWVVDGKSVATPGKEIDMYKRLVSSLYVLNIIFQAFFTLLFPVGLGALVAYLLTKHVGVGSWIWVVLLIFGVFSGLWSMVKFVLSAMAAIERLEKGQNERKNAENTGKVNEQSGQEN